MNSQSKRNKIRIFPQPVQSEFSIIEGNVGPVHLEQSIIHCNYKKTYRA
jgi:hypothetical protein